MNTIQPGKTRKGKKADVFFDNLAQRNEMILQTAIEGFWIIDVSGTILQVNPSAAAFLGYLPEDLLQKTVYSFEPAGKSQMAAYIRTAVRKGSCHYEASLLHKDGKTIFLEFNTRYIEAGEGSFLFSFFRDITSNNLLIQSLKDREADLKLKLGNLKEMNAAQKALIRKHESDIEDLEEMVLFNVKETILPYIKKLRESVLNEKQGTFLTILEANVKDITSSFSPKLTSRHFKFTKAELQIAKLVRMGITSREIAELMGLSRRTVESHRDRIRKKIGLENRRRNLRTYLMSIE